MSRLLGEDRPIPRVEVSAAPILAIVVALTASGCIHFTYDETTPLPASLSATSTPTPTLSEQPAVTHTIGAVTVCPTSSSTSTPVVTVTEPAPTVTSAAATEGRYHVVQPGETLFSIGLRYGMTVEDLAAANNLLDPTSLQVGQRLLIPSLTKGRNTYVVQAGDTLYAIAQRFNTSVVALAALNDIAPPYAIKVGQTLVLPAE
jgi:LysM repeat protein